MTGNGLQSYVIYDKIYYGLFLQKANIPNREILEQSYDEQKHFA